MFSGCWVGLFLSQYSVVLSVVISLIIVPSGGEAEELHPILTLLPHWGRTSHLISKLDAESLDFFT